MQPSQNECRHFSNVLAFWISPKQMGQVLSCSSGSSEGEEEEEGAGEEEAGGAPGPPGAGVGLPGEGVGLGGAAQGAPLHPPKPGSP